jgi:polar amino acid transport system substrate-binding protein
MIWSSQNWSFRIWSTSLLAVGLLMSLAPSSAQAQIAGTASLGSKGELRTALVLSNPVLVTRTLEGEPGGVLVEIANALGAKVSLPVRLVPYANTVRYSQSVGRDEWDVALAPRDLSRVDRLGFSEPFIEIDNGYVARSGSMLRGVDDVDHNGIRVAVAEGSPADGFLTRTLRNAKIIRLLNGFDAARDALAFAQADVYGDYMQVTYHVAAEVPGATVLVGRFNVVQMTFAVPKGNSPAIAMLNDFIHGAKRDGTIAELIKRAGLRGIRPGR